MKAKKAIIKISKAQPNRPPDKLEVVAQRLLGEIRELIDRTRQRMAQAINAGLAIRNWHIGVSIRKEILGEVRAEYGKEIVGTLSRQLTAEYGRGYGRSNLFNMVRFAEVFPDLEIVQTLSGQFRSCRRDPCSGKS